MKAFVIDVKHCCGCYCCQVACKDEHCSNDWTPYAKQQPDTGHFWGKLNEYVRGTVPKVKMAYVFVPCQHCEDAPCISICPVGAIYTRDDGLVTIDPNKCIGCRICLGVDSCPYGVIYFNDSLNIAQKCTGCAHLVDRGFPINGARCADACPTEAIHYGEESELSNLIKESETLNPEYGLSTRVHYIGLPKRFIAGTVYDPINKEVVIGATCTLEGENGKVTTNTDSYGDFWFENLGIGSYSLKIEATGFSPWTQDSISTDNDVNLGDIALS